MTWIPIRVLLVVPPHPLPIIISFNAMKNETRGKGKKKKKDRKMQKKRKLLAIESPELEDITSPLESKEFKEFKEMQCPKNREDFPYAMFSLHVFNL